METSMELKKQKYLALQVVEKARYELCVLNEMIDKEIDMSRVRHEPDRKLNALKRSKKVIDSAFEGFSGFAVIEWDLKEGGF